jgi:hypothetical protein
VAEPVKVALAVEAAVLMIRLKKTAYRPKNPIT